MAYTAYYQISRLVGEVTCVAQRAAKSARQSYDASYLKTIKGYAKMARQFQVEIDDLTWHRLGGIESQCIFTGMIASLRILSTAVTSLRDTDYDWTSRKRVQTNWKNIRQGVTDHFSDLASSDMYISGDPYWLAFEAKSWLEAWRNNLQVYFNT